MEFFFLFSALELKNAKIIAFGSTRKVNVKVEDDDNLLSLLKAGVAAICIFGKSWDYQVTHILSTSLTENLSMIGDTVGFLKRHHKEVVFDAEHFFDGYQSNPEYALQTLQAATDAGAESFGNRLFGGETCGVMDGRNFSGFTVCALVGSEDLVEKRIPVTSNGRCDALHLNHVDADAENAHIQAG